MTSGQDKRLARFSSNAISCHAGEPQTLWLAEAGLLMEEPDQQRKARIDCRIRAGRPGNTPVFANTGRSTLTQDPYLPALGRNLRTIAFAIPCLSICSQDQTVMPLADAIAALRG